MSGIYGIINERSSSAEETSRRLSKMAVALRQDNDSLHLPYVSAQAGFSLATLKGQPETSSYLDDEHGRFLLLDGSIYEYRGAARIQNPDIPTIAKLFDEYEVEIADKLVGNFNLLVWDEKRCRLVVMNDWFGLGTLFYSFSEGVLRLAPEIKAILFNLSSSPRLDFQGLAEYIHFWNLLDDRTFFEHITLLPPASILEYEDGRLSVRPYWHLTLSEEEADEQKVEKLADHGLELLKQAVARTTAGREQIGITLTGGMDSRMLLAIACGQGKDVLAITYGHSPRCEDNLIAREVVKIVKPREHVFQVLPPTMLADDSAEYVWLTDGLTRPNCTHIIMLAKKFRDRMDVLLNGIFGGHTSIGASAYYKDEQIRKPRGPEELYNRIYNWNAMSDWWKDLLFLPDFAKRIKALVRQSVDEQVRKRTTQADLLCNQIDLYAIHNHMRRNMNQVDAWKYFVDDQRPFGDPDLLKFYSSLPPTLRTNMRLYKMIYLKHYPQLARLPWHHTGVPVFAHAGKWHKIRREFRWRWRYYLGRLSGGRINIPDNHFYVQWDQWIRTEQKVWSFVEAILFDKRAMERGWYSRTGIETLLRMHKQGGMYYNTIIELLALELWARAFLDREPVMAEKIAGASTSPSFEMEVGAR